MHRADMATIAPEHSFRQDSNSTGLEFWNSNLEVAKGIQNSERFHHPALLHALFLEALAQKRQARAIGTKLCRGLSLSACKADLDGLQGSSGVPRQLSRATVQTYPSTLLLGPTTTIQNCFFGGPTISLPNHCIYF